MVSMRHITFSDIPNDARPAIWEEDGGTHAIEFELAQLHRADRAWRINVCYRGPGYEPVLTFLPPNLVGVSELGRTLLLDFGARRVLAEIKVDGAAYSLIPFGNGILIVSELMVLVVDRLGKERWVKHFSDVVSSFRHEGDVLRVEFMDCLEELVTLPDPNSL